jgi:hypothetical protein
MRSPFALIAAAAYPCLAPAAVINIDFTAGTAPLTYSGLAAAADPAGSSAYWNAIGRDGTKDRVAQVPLHDSTGTLVSALLSLGLSGSHASVNGDLERSGGYDPLMSDYLFLNSGSSTAVTTASGTLSGLLANASYELYFYGQGDKFTGHVFAGQNTLFTMDGISKQTSWDGVSGGDGLLVEGVEFVKFYVTADEQGRINFQWSNVVAGVNVDVDADGLASRYAGFNALQLVYMPAAVPEPSSALLATLAGGLACLRRRRR